MAELTIRPATSADAEALAAIYGHAVRHGTGTFETTPPDALEMDRRRRASQDLGLPYLVGELDGRVAGFASAAPYRPRYGYRFTAEDSVYIAPDLQGLGVGGRLLAAVIEACEAYGLRQLVAVIGDSANAASIALHRALGFEDAGIGRSFGFKQGRWLDIVWMQKPLNGGDQRPPDRRGIPLEGGPPSGTD